MDQPEALVKVKSVKAKKNEYELIIIGGGPAGMTAAVGAAQNGIRALMIEETVLGGNLFAIGRVKNYLGVRSGISGEELANVMKEQVLTAGIDIVWDKVCGIEVTDHKVTLKTVKNMIYSAPYIIMATGLRPKKLGVPGEEKYMGGGVSYYAVIDEDFFSNKTVAIVGGGNFAVLQASYLEKIASKIVIVYRGEDLKALSVLKKKVEDSPIFDVRVGHYVESIYGENYVKGLKVRETKTGENLDIPVDGVVICVGMSPNTEVVSSIVKLDEKGFVITDETRCSSHPRIYVAGDICSKMIRQIVNASSDGLIAVKAIHERLG